MTDKSPFTVPSAIARTHADAKGSGAAIDPAPVRKLLVIVDDTPEAQNALTYACNRAAVTGAHIALLAVIGPKDFQQWAAVQEVMQEEAFDMARVQLYELAGQVSKVTGRPAEFILKKGDMLERVHDVIADDPSIRLLVLGAAAGSDGPGPLISKIAADSGSFPVPVTLVPGNLGADQIA